MRHALLLATALAAAGCFDFARLGQPPDGVAGDLATSDDLGGGGGDDLAGDELGAGSDMATTAGGDLATTPGGDMAAAITLAAWPAPLTILAGSFRRMQANLPVTWSVTEPGGGTVDSFGYYVAPSTTGTYHVVATTTSTPTQQLSINVTVVAKGIGVLAGALGGTGNNNDRFYDARLDFPEGLARASDGSLYIGDCNNHQIRKLGTDGTLSLNATVTGCPTGLATDGKGNLCYADSQTFAVYCGPVGLGIFNVLAGVEGAQGTNDGTGGGARFTRPYGLTSDGNGTLYVTDAGANSVRSISSAGTTTTILASGLSNPEGISYRPNGSVYVADNKNNRIVLIDVANKVVTAMMVLNNAYAVAWDDNAATLYAHDTHAIYSYAGATSTLIAGAPGTFGNGADGTGIGARFGGLDGMVTDGSGTLWAVDNGAESVRKIVIASPTPVTTIGPPLPQPGSTSGAPTSARFQQPTQMAVAGGKLYIADSGNNMIRMWDGSQIWAYSGATASGSTDSPARYSAPAGLASDGKGHLFVTDRFNQTIREIDLSTNAVSTLAGSPGLTGSANGVGSSARFSYPQGIASDGNDTLFICDTQNGSVRKLTVSTQTVATLTSGLSNPYGVFYQGGATPTLWVSDANGLEQIDPSSGSLAAVTGSPRNLFSQIASDGASLYFGDARGQLWKFVIATRAFSVAAGTMDHHAVVPGGLPGVLNAPTGFAWFNNELVVSDLFEPVLLRVDL